MRNRGVDVDAAKNIPKDENKLDFNAPKACAVKAKSILMIISTFQNAIVKAR